MAIEGVSHVTVPVVDRDRARGFYCEKIGFEVREDVRMGDHRWLTVGPRDLAGPFGEVRLVLHAIRPGPMLAEDLAAQLRSLVEGGGLVLGVLRTGECRGTCERLRARGVPFVAERPHGVEAIFRDDSGNRRVLVEPAE